MLKCLHKYGYSFDVVKPTYHLLRELPFWHHLGKRTDARDGNNYLACKCLRDNHGVLYTKEGLAVMNRLEDEAHSPSATCECLPCSDDRRNKGCANPHACAKAVVMGLDRLSTKWDP
ncbi:hypothetical protein GGX14DRAFT_336259, partial [Mycena pura]